MIIHLAIYHPHHAGILSAAVELTANQVILLHRNGDDISGVQAACRTRGIECHSHVIGFDTTEVRSLLKEIINSNTSNSLILNASSGYKKIMLLAHEQFNLYQLPVFMVDKFTNQLHWIKSSVKSAEANDFTLTCRIKLQEYLKTFNTEVLESGHKTPEPAASRALTEWIITELGNNDKAIASLNYMAMSANANHQFQMSAHDLKNHPLQQLLDHFQTAGKLTVKGKRINFKNQKARFYCNGGWLENHVFSILYEMRKNRPSLTDLARGVTINRNKGAVKNELDVTAMFNNRLHIIECKTKRFKNRKSNNTDANTAIYRLDTIKSISGGHSGKAMLISYEKLNRYTLSRAKDLGIFCCSHIQLKQLQRHLYQFIDA